jgi:hypothetical protein
MMDVVVGFVVFSFALLVTVSAVGIGVMIYAMLKEAQR